MIGRLLIVLAAIVLAWPATGVAPPVDAKKKSRNRTETFTNAGTIAIPEEGEATPFPSTINVTGFKGGKITDIEVSLDGLSHTFPNDIAILLVAPNDRPAFILNGAGGGDDVTNIDLTFDDDAAAVIPDVGPMVGGRFRASVFDLPAGTNAQFRSLSALKGINPNGVWQLFVFDTTDDEEGQIANGWSLEITARVKAKSKKK
jgi:subtilisin-like proprotein convertase family protein